MALTKFEWDSEKNDLNIEKHGVSFAIAQYAFADPYRIIAKDESHSQAEERFYCFAPGGTDATTTLRYRVKQFMKIIENAEKIKEFDGNLFLRII